ncbi:hypothetical protein GYMLUDRAFT_960526 [Collybiopsis luxurians FD-317 M1]|nr:hypothetical protein GYMLUDRAFT_960526 [Collybiopsis luxurians FD-317 M1]
MTFVPFCRALNQGETFAESLASMVEHCTFRDWFGFLAGPNPAARAFLKFSMEALPNMPNITTLALYRIRLNPDPKRSNADRDRRIPSMLSTIQNLPHLSSLTLDSCDFREVTANAIEKFASRANLETFCLFLREDPLIMPPCDNITKEFLPLIKNLTKLGTDSWTLIQILISPNVSSSLRTLEALNILDLHSFSDYLYRTPSLESLTVDHLPQVLPLHSLAGQVGDAISLSQLPNLRHLSCPPHATSCFGSPRSLLSLSFTSHSDKQIYRHPISDIWSNIQSYRFIADVCLPFEFVVKTATSRVNTPNTAPQRLQRLTVVNSANFSITGGLFKAVSVNCSSASLYRFIICRHSMNFVLLGGHHRSQHCGSSI